MSSIRETNVGKNGESIGVDGFASLNLHTCVSRAVRNHRKRMIPEHRGIIYSNLDGKSARMNGSLTFSKSLIAYGKTVKSIRLSSCICYFTLQASVSTICTYMYICICVCKSLSTNDLRFRGGGALSRSHTFSAYHAGNDSTI